MRTPKVAVIGSGAGGLAAAIDLARQGVAVTMLEKAARPGGKIRTDTAGIDAGPTVLTMRWVFEALFQDAGAALDDHLTLYPAEILARHAWSATERLDLFADVQRSAEAIRVFAGPTEAAGYQAFCARARRVYETLEQPFMMAQKPSVMSLTAAAGPSRMLGISAFATLWKALGEHFHDPRLRQLFGRYATYSGSSPFLAPATLMLIAHAEQRGVWLVEGGMARLATALADLGAQLGVTARYESPVAEILVRGGRAIGVALANGEQMLADAVICNADCAALAAGAFGIASMGAVPPAYGAGQSLSAITWTMLATAGGFPLDRHNVFFNRDYAAEFDALFRARRVAADPTVYVCAQDRGQPGPQPEDGPERLLVLINAPAGLHLQNAEIDQCANRTFEMMRHCGLTLRRETTTVTTPAQFDVLFPATRGALYGQAVHGAMAAFRRPGSRSALPGLYLAGGSVHPGPGVPMAIMSGRLAAESLVRDLTSA